MLLATPPPIEAQQQLQLQVGQMRDDMILWTAVDCTHIHPSHPITHPYPSIQSLIHIHSSNHSPISIHPITNPHPSIQSLTHIQPSNHSPTFMLSPTHIHLTTSNHPPTSIQSLTHIQPSNHSPTFMLSLIHIMFYFRFPSVRRIMEGRLIHG